MVCEHEVGAHSNDQNPVVGLDDKHLGHEAIEGAELGLLGRPDPPATHVHGGRDKEIERHDAVADGQAKDQLMAEGAKIGECLETGTWLGEGR